MPFPSVSAPGETEPRLLWVRRLLVATGVAIPCLAALPELLHLTPDLNDGAFHLGVLQNVLSAIADRRNPFDFWVPTWQLGYPLFRTYQPGPYLALAFVHLAALGALPLLLVYRLVGLAALVLFPVANYRAMRWLGYDALAASCAAFLSWLVSGSGYYGIELESFLWGGWGLFAQQLALPLLPLALAGAYRAVDSGGRTLRWALLLAAACLSHVLYGYIAAVSAVLVPFLLWEREEVLRRASRLVRFGVQAGALLAFFALPLATSLPYHAKSLYDEAAKFDSYGAAEILTRLLAGKLLDGHRLPVLTVLALAGLYLAAREWTEKKSRADGFLAAGFVLWLLLYFGRATWGPLTNLLPLSGGLHLERLSSGVQIFAIWLAAVSLARLLRLAASLELQPLRAAAAALLLLGVALPMLHERTVYAVWNARLVERAAAAYRAEWPAFEPVLRRLRSEPPGRVYAGHSGNWGRTYQIGPVQVYHLLSAEAIDTIGYGPFSWALPGDFQYAYDPSDIGGRDLWDVRYVLTDQPSIQPPGAELLIRSGKHALYRMPTEGPFAIVSAPLAVAGDKETTWYATEQWTGGPWPRARAHARLVFEGAPPAGVPAVRMVDPFRYLPEGAPALPGTAPSPLFAAPGLFAAPAPPVPGGNLSRVEASPGEASVTVALPAPATILFRSTYSPRWIATVDGAERPTALLTPGMVGVEVPAGRHHLRLRYSAGWGKLGLLALGLLVAVGIDARRPRSIGGAG